MSSQEYLSLSIRESFLMPVELRLLVDEEPASLSTCVLEVSGARGHPELRRIPLEPATANYLIAAFDRVRVGRPDFICGLDGTTYELTLSRGMNSLVLTWWVRLPAQWSELEEPIRKLLDLAGNPVGGTRYDVPVDGT